LFSDDNELCFLEELSEDRPLPEEIAVVQETRQHLLQAIEALPVRYRSVVLLRSISQYSFAEIGQTLHMPKTTAKTYFHRAKQRLRAYLMEKEE
jgi:RNA polymerase sigma-70 factor (ECF subfamily)